FSAYHCTARLSYRSDRDAAETVEQQRPRSCRRSRIAAAFNRTGNFSLLVVEKNAAAISLGTTHSLRASPHVGAWICAWSARSPGTIDYIDYTRALRGMELGAQAIKIVEHCQRRQLGHGAVGIALRADCFAPDSNGIPAARFVH